MGFNKCHLTKKMVSSYYEKGGIEEVCKLLAGCDSFITEDCSFLLNFTTLDQIREAEPEIKSWLNQDEP